MLIICLRDNYSSISSELADIFAINLFIHELVRVVILFSYDRAVKASRELGLCTFISSQCHHGRKSGETRGKSPRIWSAGNANANLSPDLLCFRMSTSDCLHYDAVKCTAHTQCLTFL